MAPEPPSLLIVEDEVLLAMDVEVVAEEEGFRIAGTALRQDEALRLAARTRPAVALVDVHLLDGFTGIEVARQIARDPATLVVFMTANRQGLPEDLAGACGVLPKPYSEASLRASLRFLRALSGGQAASDAVPPGLELGPRCLDLHGARPSGDPGAGDGLAGRGESRPRAH